jgi:hypothetical protein
MTKLMIISATALTLLLLLIGCSSLTPSVAKILRYLLRFDHAAFCSMSKK